MSHFDDALQRAEAELDRAHDAAAWDLRTDFSQELRRHRLHRHKITIEQLHRHAELCINGQPWWSCLRASLRPDRFPITTLLKDIADTLEKCDTGVLRHLYGVTL